MRDAQNVCALTKERTVLKCVCDVIVSSPRKAQSSGYLAKVLLNSKTNKKTLTYFCSGIQDLRNSDSIIYVACVRNACTLSSKP